MEFKFTLDTLELEIDRKIESMLSDSDHFELELMDNIVNVLGEDSLVKTNSTLSYAKSLPFIRKEESFKGYFNHPIRVTNYSIQAIYPPNLDIIHLGLMHNVYEVSGLKENDIEVQGYCNNISKGIRLMTIDRSLQEDVDYLNEYYGDIEDYSKELATIKCFDKLDNMLAFELIEENDEKFLYIDLAQKFVVPIANRLSSQFGSFCSDLITYIKKAGCRNDLRDKYLKFINLKQEIK